MNHKKQGMPREGKAVFLEWEGSALSEADNLWELRQQSKVLLLDGETPARYVVTDVVDFYPGVVNVILGNMTAMDHHLETITGDVDSETDGVFSCVVFWDMHQREGVLLHRRDGQWLVAVLPLVDAAIAEREERAVTELAALAMRTEGIPIRVDRPIERGRHVLSHVLDMLAEQIDV